MIAHNQRRRPDAAEAIAVLDRMATDHASIAPAVAALEAAACALAAVPTDDARRRTLGALDDLSETLLPHLRDEEDAAMPVAARLITAAEWQAVEKEHNLDGKSTSDLGFEGHWLIDGASDADRETVLALVPPVQRFLLLHGFAGRYRRHARACWGDEPRPPRRVQLDNEVVVTVDAGIDDVWAVVCDVTRVGEWSHECVSASWLGDSRVARPGSRFRGRNRARIFRWGRVCEVMSADPFELVWRTVPTTAYPDSSEWSIALEPVGAGTRITQRFHVVKAPKVLSVVYALMLPNHRDRTAALTGDLHRLGAVSARSPVAG
jgi:hypothetical protein